MAINIGHLEAFLGLNTLGLTKGLATAQASMKKAGASMRRIGRNMTMSLSLPLLAIGGGAVKMAVDFEKSMSKIVGQVGIAREVVQGMRKDVLALAGPTARSPQELADALFFVTSAGLRGAEAMEVLRLSARAAASGFGETKLVADLVTSATNAYGIANLSAAEAMDTLAAAVREGKSEAVDIAGAMGQVLPIASNLGVSFQEVGASIAAMSRTGTVARTAVIQLRQILASILSPSQKAEEAFDKMGTSSAQLRDVLGEEQGLLKLLMFLREEMKTNKLAFADAFPNIRALSGALDIMGNNAEDNIAIWDRMRSNVGDADKAFDAAADTVSHQFNVALAELKVEAIALGDTLMPIFKGIINAVRNGVRWFKNLSSTSKRFGLILAGVAIAIGPVIFLIGSMVTAVSALMGPIGLVVAGLILLVGGFSAATAAAGKVTDSIIKEQTELNALVGAIQDVNNTEESRSRLIAELQKKYPSFLGNLNAEKVTNEQLSTILEKVNKQYEQKILLALKEEEITNNIKKQVNLRKRELELIKKISEGRPDPSTVVGVSGIDHAVEAYNRLNGSLVLNRKEQEKLKEEVIEINKLYENLGLTLETLSSAPTTPTTPTAPIEGGIKIGGLTKTVTLLKKSILSLQTPWQSFKKMMADRIANPIEDWGGHELPKIIDETKVAITGLGMALQTTLNQGLITLGETLGNIFTGDAGAANFFDSILLIVASFMQTFGKALIAAGVAAVAFKSLLVNPILAIGAGIALVAASAVVKNLLTKGPGGNLQGMRSGGFVTEGGAFQLHKDEVVSLPAGAAVTSQRASRAGGSPQKLIAIIKGEDIYLVNEEYKRKLGNTN